MTTSDKRQLYNEIMSSLYKTVTKIIDETYNGRLNEAFESNTLKKFISFAQGYAKEHNKDYEIRFVWAAQSFDMFNVKYDGSLLKGTYRPTLSDLGDENILNKKFYKFEELNRVLKNHKPNYNSMKSMTVGKDFSFLILIDWNEVKKDQNTDVVAAMIIDPKGTKAIYDATQKRIKRKEEKQESEQKLTDNQSKIAYQREMFRIIKKDYEVFKKKYGDKAAVELGKVVNNMFKDDRVKAILRQQLQDDTDMKKYLFGFMLKREDHFGFMDFMEKNKNLCLIRDKFYERLKPLDNA